MWGMIATWRMAAEGITAGAELLAAGKSSGDAVETAIRAVEDFPYYKSVGYGGLPNEEMEVEMDAAFMDGNTLDIGAVAAIRDFANPVSIARRLSREKVNSLLVACYAIGWRITGEELEEYPHLRFAAGEDDTGVIIAFNSEAEDVTDSLMIPAGTRTLAINPLNWETDGTPAGKEENLGACFTDYSGEIITEIPQLTGAYIDPERGALKVPDVSPDDYPPGLDIFSEGVYPSLRLSVLLSEFAGKCRRARQCLSRRGGAGTKGRVVFSLHWAMENPG